MYYTTLNEIWAHRPCHTVWDKLLSHLGKRGPDDEPLSLLTILKSNGIDDAIWALRAVSEPACERDARIFAVRCVRQSAQHLLADPRSLNALDVAELYAIGEATIEELEAAKAAAKAAAWAAAWDAARAAAQAAAQAAAWAAAWAAEAAADAARHAADAAAEAVITAAQAAQAALDAAWDEMTAVESAAWPAMRQDFIDIFCS